MKKEILLTQNQIKVLLASLPNRNKDLLITFFVGDNEMMIDFDSFLLREMLSTKTVVYFDDTCPVSNAILDSVALDRKGDPKLKYGRGLIILNGRRIIFEANGETPLGIVDKTKNVFVKIENFFYVVAGKQVTHED